MAVRQMVSDEELDVVSGGVSYTRKWGDGTLYKLRMNRDTEYSYTFPVDRKQDVLDIIAATADPSLGEDENDDNIMAALLAEPDLLSPL